MKRTIELYIDGRPADLDGDSLILFNYALTDLTSPTAVKNSYSQSVTLPGTPTNDEIFGHIYRTDHFTQPTGFSPMVRTPFYIKDVNGSVLESGYLRLTEITCSVNGIHTFKVSLYGGLGSFLWALTYGSEGDKKTLADLVYLNGGGADELSFDITRQTVATAWSRLSYPAQDKWSVINFAPCYNGAPTDFDADKILLNPSSTMGRISATHPQDASYGVKDGYLLAELGQEYDEWTMRDLRSYLQRPILRVRATIEACCNPVNNGGWTVNLDSAFFNASNPYWMDTWMALSMLSAQNGNSPSSEPITVTYAGSAMSGEGYATLTPSQALGPGKTTAIINSLLNIDSTPVGSDQYLYSESGVVKYETFILVQLVGYDADGNVIGGSPLIALKDEDANGTPYEIATAIGYYTGYGRYGGTVDGIIVSGKWSEPLQQVCTGFDAAYWKLHFKAVTKKTEWNGSRYVVTWESPKIYDDKGNIDTEQTFTATWAKDTSTSDSILVENFDGVRSGAHITKQMLLGSGSVTPASFLLSYCKTFGLYITADPASKTISIRTRNTQYDGVRLDWSGRIDRSKDITTVPVAAESQWYEMAHEVVEGASAKDYADEYGREYGSMRLDTGYEFNSDVKELLEDNAFKAAVEVLGMSRDYSIPKVNTTFYPNWMVSSVKVTYYNAGGETKELETGNIIPTDRTYWSGLLDSADCFPKVQFCDADGGEVDGYGTLLFLCSVKYANYTGNYFLSDDWAGMYEMNGGTPCWLVDTSLEHNQVVVPPQFSRAMRSNDLKQITKQLEFTTPKQIYNGYVNSYLGSQALYPKFWAAYLGDLYDADARVMTCRVDLRGVKVDAELLRHFYVIDGGLWVLNKISNYSITTLDPCECEFVKVKDATDYTNGQDLT